MNKNAHARLHSVSLWGLKATMLEVEVHLTPGLPGISLVGLADTAVKEAKERVRSALLSSGFGPPQSKIMINLAPASLKKEGAGLDLPMALGVGVALKSLETDRMTDYAYVGELALDGRLRAVRGVLAMVWAAKKAGLKGIVVPRANFSEAHLVKDFEIIGVNHLKEAFSFLGGEAYKQNDRSLALAKPKNVEPKILIPDGEDLADVKGQVLAKRALAIAAAGRHNLLFNGPPGSGKSMLAKRLPALLPPLTETESMDVTLIQSLTGQPVQGLAQSRPFCNPHHTVSDVGLVGGGSHPKPGQITLAHHGVLFLDELPEFQRRTLDLLRQPLEEKTITIARAHGVMTFPASFLLIAAMNPCPCGYAGDPRCLCTPLQIKKYRSRISGPFLDRIDLLVSLEPVSLNHMFDDGPGIATEDLRKNVLKAVTIQKQRYGPSGCCNADMKAKDIKALCPLDQNGRRLLQKAVEKFTLSNRVVHRLLKVARTIADMAQVKEIRSSHLAEALAFRQDIQGFCGASSGGAGSAWPVSKQRFYQSSQ